MSHWSTWAGTVSEQRPVIRMKTVELLRKRGEHLMMIDVLFADWLCLGAEVERADTRLSLALSLWPIAVAGTTQQRPLH